MGMYCCCEERISGPYFECSCDWEGWNSIIYWPPERKNKDKPCSNPDKDGEYLVRIQTNCGDRYEDKANFFLVPRIIKCEYTGKDMQVYWSGNHEEQPYAWKEIEVTK